MTKPLHPGVLLFSIAAAVCLFLSDGALASYLQEGGTADRTGRVESDVPKWNDVAWAMPLTSKSEDRAVARAPPIILHRTVYLLMTNVIDLTPVEAVAATRLFHHEPILYSIDLDAPVPVELHRWPERNYDENDRDAPIGFASDGKDLFVAHFDGVDRVSTSGEILASIPHPTRLTTPKDKNVCLAPAVTPSMIYVVCNEWGGPEETKGHESDIWETGGNLVVAAYDLDLTRRAWEAYPNAATQLTGQDPLALGSPTTYSARGFSVVGKNVLVQTPCYARLSDCIFAYDAKTGRQTWAAPAEDHYQPSNLAPTVTHAASRALAMKYPVATDAGAVTGDEERVFYKGVDVVILSQSDGKQTQVIEFREDRAEGDWGSSAAFDGQYLYLPAARRLVPHAVDGGQPPWKPFVIGPEELWSRGPILLANGTLLARAEDFTGRVGGGRVTSNTLYAVDARTGTQLWKHPLTVNMKTGSYWAFTVAAGAGVVVAAGIDGTITVLGRTDASLIPVLPAFNRYPRVGEAVTLDLSGARAGRFGAATQYRVDWGEGDGANWTTTSRFTHRYLAPRDFTARFEVRNDVGQTASETVLFRVGAMDPDVPPPPAPVVETPAKLTLLQLALAPENLGTTIGLLVPASAALLVAAFLLGSRRREAPAAKAQRYQIEREIGKGRLTRTFLARDRVLDRRVVLKQPLGTWLADAATKRQFLREAANLSKIQHANVVGLHEILTDEDLPVLVMAYVPGGSLADLLSAPGRLEPEEAVEVALDILLGVDELHRHGLVHRDLKPANILLDGKGRAMVADLGLAKDIAGGAATQHSGHPTGTLYYMSPEQARGEPAGVRSDLFAVAVILRELVTGEHYLGAPGQPPHVIHRKLQESEPPPELPHALSGLTGVLEKAMAREPEDRYENAADMRAALERALGRSEIPPMVRLRPRVKTRQAAGG